MRLSSYRFMGYPLKESMQLILVVMRSLVFLLTSKQEICGSRFFRRSEFCLLLLKYALYALSSFFSFMLLVILSPSSYQAVLSMKRKIVWKDVCLR